jgi:glucose-6-phosphate isomerase
MSRGTKEAPLEVWDRRLIGLGQLHVSREAQQTLAAAIGLARVAHAGQHRKQGGPYLVHPLRVAILLLEEFGLRDGNVIAAGVLHDVLEDSQVAITGKDIEMACNRDVAQLVEVVTSPRDSVFPDKLVRNRQKAEKVLTGPQRAWYIKLADRVDNVRDALALTDDAGRKFRARYHQETLDYYLPMAERLGEMRVRDIFMTALTQLGECVTTDGLGLGRLAAAGVELDLARMFMPHDCDHRYDFLLDRALEAMQAVERGEYVNRDEGWQVGHYWLRNPALAPAEYRDGITGMWRAIDQFARQYVEANTFRHFLWIGIGGSGLGPQMLYESLRQPRRTPPMWFIDNTDPNGIGRILQEVGDLADTLTIVVSKSGTTKETRNGMLIVQQAYRDAGLPFERHAVAITRPKSVLDKLAAGTTSSTDPWVARFPLWDWVGGRTSLCSAVGMLAAAVLRLDGRQLREGAREMDDATRGGTLQDNPALRLAAAWYHTVDVQGLRNMAVLPYCDQLEMLPRYLQQLVMESLGKEGKGITVFGNKGSTDQHAFVQQLREGYRDFFVSFLRILVPQSDCVVEPEKPTFACTSHLTGITAGDYLAAFQEGTAEALADAGRLSMRISVEQVDEFSLGALIALFERAVGYYGAMLGINAYHQPGVEAGKKAAGKILDLQRRLVEFLESQPGTELRVGTLAEAVGASEALVYDVLDRLARCKRFDIMASTIEQSGLANRGFVCRSPAAPNQSLTSAGPKGGNCVV